ncbi:MAG: chemotaxis response regulator protein-glutamate methylesterase [Pseudomonadota bacterium]
MTIRVLIVDDSALVRQLLTELLSADPQIQVVGTAQDPLVAREKIKELNPDVLTLDVEMPRMDGLTFLENLMRLRPMPVIMVSSLTERGAEVTLQALELGAVDFVTKPKLDVANGLQMYADDLREKIKAAATVKPRGPALLRSGGPVPEAPKKKAGPRMFRTTDKLIAIGASTGGTEAIKVVLEGMPPDAPAIVITQHIPAAFSRPFAERMNRSCAMSVCEASDGQLILPGHAYIAPGGFHLLVRRDGAKYVCQITDTDPVNRHKPSVDVLFKSVSETAGPNAVGLILTGMGDDGARGLKLMRDAGAHTLCQDEASSVVWGMPGSAHRIGAVEQVLPLSEMADAALRSISS